MSNPIIKSTRHLLIYTTTWIIYTGISIFFYKLAFKDLSFSIALLDGLVFNGLFAIIGIFIWYPVYYSSIEKRKWLNIIFNHLASFAITLLLWINLGHFILRALVPESQLSYEFLRTSIIWRLASGSFMYLIITLIYYLVIYYKNFQDKLLRESELKALVKESELASLKAQINPHFLFNSLNSISSLTITNPEKSQEMIIKLSEFLRYSIGKNQKEKTTLKQEIENIQRYLDIEKIRFDERFDLNIKINKNCEGTLLPNMILQPLVENSIKHGVYESIEKVKIEINCTATWDYLEVNIRNTYDPDAVSKKGAGVGLKNIMNRLSIIYNRNDLLRIEKKDNVFNVRLLVPQEK